MGIVRGAEEEKEEGESSFSVVCSRGFWKEADSSDEEKWL